MARKVKYNKDLIIQEPMATNKSQIVSGITKYYAMNNPAGLVKAMAAQGIKIPNGMNADEAMYGVYLKNPELFHKIAKSVPYNSRANNVTTSMNYNSILYLLVGWASLLAHADFDGQAS